ncbi:hypothetical protein DEU38_13437 [Rhodococcus sp. AG1013]|uniref:DUF6221 family protein n=1 Tax=Rhodococcus sp. AG1013 TaxID=2183996 RepID=UPI000E0AAE4E|nr:DUF6221 family protein [Rhodococcus sp. AG1013]RDI13462.1 hypothetical protein DEU38_13437 [Rhodococcus sp. AG1013]
MSEIVEFLRARLDEDERVARAAVIRYGLTWWRTDAPDDVDEYADWPGFVCGDHPALAVLDRDDDNDGPHADHIARHDPARVAREVAAKRAILAQEEEARAHYDHIKSSATYPVETSIGHVVALATVIRHLASAYADHPDYREDWRPA